MSYSCPQKIKNGALSFVDDFIEITGKQILFVKSNSTYCLLELILSWTLSSPISCIVTTTVGSVIVRSYVALFIPLA